MRSTLITATCLASLVACSSSTVIRSYPSGAHVFINGKHVGTTPYTLSDRKVVSSTTSIRLEYPGLPPLDTTISRNERVSGFALIGGLLVLVPFLWIMGYDGEHAYDLTASRRPPPPQPGPDDYEQPGYRVPGAQPDDPPRDEAADEAAPDDERSAPAPQRGARHASRAAPGSNSCAAVCAKFEECNVMPHKRCMTGCMQQEATLENDTLNLKIARTSCKAIHAQRAAKP